MFIHNKLMFIYTMSKTSLYILQKTHNAVKLLFIDISYYS